MFGLEFLSLWKKGMNSRDKKIHIQQKVLNNLRELSFSNTKILTKLDREICR